MLYALPPDLQTLTQIARQIPGARGAKQLHPATLTRWILTGAKSTDGTTVRLKATRCGHRWLVRAADLHDFFEVLAGPAEGPAAVRTPGQRRRASERAATQLKNMGA